MLYSLHLTPMRLAHKFNVTSYVTSLSPLQCLIVPHNPLETAQTLSPGGEIGRHKGLKIRSKSASLVGRRGGVTSIVTS